MRARDFFIREKAEIWALMVLLLTVNSLGCALKKPAIRAKHGIGLIVRGFFWSQFGLGLRPILIGETLKPCFPNLRARDFFIEHLRPHF